MNIKLNDLELNASLDEETMTGLSGGYTPNPMGPYPPRPFPLPPGVRPPRGPWPRPRPDLSKLVKRRLARRRIRR